MRFRCAQCRALTQVQIPARVTAPIVTSCSGCGRRYRFAVDRPRGADDQERYKRAKEFAEANQIDLGSAYSVLEGVMTLEDAQALRKGQPAARPRPGAAATPAAGAPRPTLPVSPRSDLEEALVQATEAAARDSPDLKSESRTAATVRTPAAAVPTTGRPALAESEVGYDPGFAEAIRDGALTPRQALERGDRRALAMRLSQRHRLPMELALRVADNRLTVHQALQLKASNEAKEPPRPQTSVSHGVWNFMVYSVGALILTGLGVHIYGVWGEYLSQHGLAAVSLPEAAASSRHASGPPAAGEAAPGVPAPPPPLTVPKTDSTGQLVEVVGPDPRSVLIAFCSTGRQSGRREPIEIDPTVPPDASARWGLFRNLEQTSIPVRAILIRKDPKTGRWSTGDGRTPIMTETPPQLPPGTRAVPVAAAGGSS